VFSLTIVTNGPPQAITGAPTDVTANSAMLNGSVNPSGISTTAYFQWGTTTNYGNTIPSPAISCGTGEDTINVPGQNVTNLKPNTIYHFRLIASNTDGTNAGADQAFATLPPLPQVTTGAATEVTNYSATLNGSVNPNGSSTTAYFQWGTTTNYGNIIPSPSISCGSGVSTITMPGQNLTDLSPGTIYHFQLVASNIGGTNSGTDQTFTILNVPYSTNLPTLFNLYNFTGGSDGANPNSGLLLGPDGNLFGTTTYGGDNSIETSGAGTVFRVTPNGLLTTLLTFNFYTSGANPYGDLAWGPNGNLYGTTSSGAFSGWGSVFEVTTNGSPVLLVLFDDVAGANPYAGLLLGPNGNFYGTTREGSGDGQGTIFQMTTAGGLTNLVSLTYSNEYPTAALVLGSDGNFYGTGIGGAGAAAGTVFRVTTNAVLTTLVAFDSYDYTNGAYPTASLLLGPDDNFYGTTIEGGLYGAGTIFKMTATGNLTTLVSFNITNGAIPNASLILGPDGNFYGTTTDYGWITNSYYPYGCGTVFRVTPGGLLTTLISFNGTNGANPQANLVLSGDTLYGTTVNGGAYGEGTVFAITGILPQAISISNVRASQRTVTNLVDIYYDLSGASAPVFVSVMVSTNCGANYASQPVSLSGDGVTTSVASGSNYHIVWNAGADLPNFLSRTMRIQLSVPGGGSFAQAVSPIFTLNTLTTATGGLTGTVLTTKGSPVTNAQVRIESPPLSTSTLSNGTFALSNIPVGNGYVLDVSAAGYAPKHLTSVNVPIASTNVGNIILTNAGGPISLIPLEPDVNPAITTVEQGGTAYRYYQVLGTFGVTNRIPLGSIPVSVQVQGNGAIVQTNDVSSYWPGQVAGISDPNGIVRVSIPATSLNTSGTIQTVQLSISNCFVETF
jgi:uncharacterized repeat protein (TIGR03803 family)